MKCEDCGNPIPAGRLAALPETTVCVKCSREKPTREEFCGNSSLAEVPEHQTAQPATMKGRRA